MRVLVVCPVYEPHAGGGGQYFPLLVESLTAHVRIDRVAVLTETHPERPWIARERGATIYRLLPPRDTRPDRSRAYSFASFLLTYCAFAVLIPWLIARHRVDVLHVSRYLRRPFYALMALCRSALGVGTVLDLRATVDEESELRALFGMDFVICNAEAVLQQVETLGVRSAHALVENPMRFPSPLPEPEMRQLLDELSPKLREPFLVCVGQLLERKSFFEVLDAFERWSASNPGYRLVLAGRNMIGARAAERIKRAANVEYVGPVSHRQAIALLQGSEAVLQPSKREGIPRVSLEALALGKKVLLPPCVPEFRQAGAAFTLHAATATDIEHGIDRVVRCRSLPEYDLSRHRPARSIEKVIAIYDAVVAGRAETAGVGAA